MLKKQSKNKSKLRPSLHHLLLLLYRFFLSKTIFYKIVSDIISLKSAHNLFKALLILSAK